MIPLQRLHCDGAIGVVDDGAVHCASVFDRQAVQDAGAGNVPYGVIGQRHVDHADTVIGNCIDDAATGQIGVCVIGSSVHRFTGLIEEELSNNGFAVFVTMLGVAGGDNAVKRGSVEGDVDGGSAPGRETIGAAVIRGKGGGIVAAAGRVVDVTGQG